ncbi:MAG: radical SAM/SPASM domain-containing protein [Bdellovibrionota bacterium]
MAARFSKVHVEISSICNLQCSFCPEVIRDKKLIEPALFRRILEQVAPITEQVAFHLMGDPLVHPKIEELVKITEEFGSRIFFVTNGTLLREKSAELLLHPAFRQVNFSLHSFPDNFPDRDPTEYLNKIFSWTERALAERPDLYVNYRLWNLADTRGAGEQNRGMLRQIEERFGWKADTEVDVRVQKSRLVKGRLYLHYDTEFTWPALELPVLGVKGTCYGLSSHFGILVDGTVVPCCLDKEGSIPLGNVKEAPIEEILGSARAQEILKGFRERRLVEALCQRCQYIERFG